MIVHMSAFRVPKDYYTTAIQFSKCLLCEKARLLHCFIVPEPCGYRMVTSPLDQASLCGALLYPLALGTYWELASCFGIVEVIGRVRLCSVRAIRTICTIGVVYRSNLGFHGLRVLEGKVVGSDDRVGVIDSDLPDVGHGLDLGGYLLDLFVRHGQAKLANTCLDRVPARKS